MGARIRPVGLYTYGGHTDIKELALFAQDTITEELGVQPRAARRFVQWHHHYRQAEPRLGVAYNFKRTNTVLRFSYARILETPFNENLILASNGCSDPVVNALMSTRRAIPA